MTMLVTPGGAGQGQPRRARPTVLLDSGGYTSAHYYGFSYLRPKTLNNEGHWYFTATPIKDIADTEYQNIST